MGQPVEQSGCHFSVAEDGGPFAEAEVGGDDDAGALIKLAQQVEEQCSTGGAERKISELIEDQQVEANQCFGDLTGFASGLLLFKRIDQFDGREEADFPTMTLDGLDAKGGRDMGFAGAWSTD